MEQQQQEEAAEEEPLRVVIFFGAKGSLTCLGCGASGHYFEAVGVEGLTEGLGLRFCIFGLVGLTVARQLPFPSKHTNFTLNALKPESPKP